MYFQCTCLSLYKHVSETLNDLSVGSSALCILFYSSVSTYVGLYSMEVILGPMLHVASQPCLHAFWVLTSLHLLFLLKMFFYYSLISGLQKGF